MLGYLSLDIICSAQFTVFLQLCSQKTVRFLEQVMAADKYPYSIFLHKMEAIVYIKEYPLPAFVVNTSTIIVLVLMLHDTGLALIEFFLHKSILGQFNTGQVKTKNNPVNMHVIFSCKFAMKFPS